MVNTQLFQTLKGALLPNANSVNAEQAPAYAFTPRHRLAQLAATGCLGQTFYANAEAQLDAVLTLAKELDTAFVAKTALYAREAGLHEGHARPAGGDAGGTRRGLAGPGVRPRDRQRQDAAQLRADRAQRCRGPQVPRLRVPRSWCSSGC